MLTVSDISRTSRRSRVTSHLIATDVPPIGNQNVSGRIQSIFTIMLVVKLICKAFFSAPEGLTNGTVGLGKKTDWTVFHVQPNPNIKVKVLLQYLPRLHIASMVMKVSH